MPEITFRARGTDYSMNYDGTAPTKEQMAAAVNAGTAKPASAIRSAPVVSPSDPRLADLSASKFLSEGIKRRAGDIASMASMAIPGSGILPFAGRVLASEGGQAVGGALSKDAPYRPGLGAASQIVGEGVGKAVSTLLTPATYASYAKRASKQIADWLKDNVPAWESFASTGKGLYAMAHGTGQRLLSSDFEQAMRSIKGAIPDTLVVRVMKPVESAGRVEWIGEPRNARMLIDDLPTLRAAGGRPYREALKALSNELPTGLAPELDEARRQYKIGAGFIDFAEKGRFLHGERYDPANAMKALDQHGKRLLGRGMDEVSRLIRGPGRDPITATKHSPWERRIYGAAAGELVGFPFGIPGRIAGPVIGGAAAEAFGPRTTYGNVPLSAAWRFARGAVPSVAAAGVREGSRQLGLTDAWPSRGAVPAAANERGGADAGRGRSSLLDEP